MTRNFYNLINNLETEYQDKLNELSAAREEIARLQEVQIKLQQENTDLRNRLMANDSLKTASDKIIKDIVIKRLSAIFKEYMDSLV